MIKILFPCPVDTELSVSYPQDSSYCEEKHADQYSIDAPYAALYRGFCHALHGGFLRMGSVCHSFGAAVWMAENTDIFGFYLECPVFFHRNYYDGYSFQQMQLRYAHAMRRTYDGGRFLHDYTMEEMIAHCSQFAGTFEPPISKEAYILQMRHIFPQLKRWRNPNVDGSDTQSVSGFLSAAQVADIEHLIDTLPVAYISSVDGEGFPWTKAMLSPRKRDGIKVF